VDEREWPFMIGLPDASSREGAPWVVSEPVPVWTPVRADVPAPAVEVEEELREVRAKAASRAGTRRSDIWRWSVRSRARAERVWRIVHYW
jgi:hypothetical protein